MNTIKKVYTILILESIAVHAQTLNTHLYKTYSREPAPITSTKCCQSYQDFYLDLCKKLLGKFLAWPCVWAWLNFAYVAEPSLLILWTIISVFYRMVSLLLKTSLHHYGNSVRRLDGDRTLNLAWTAQIEIVSKSYLVSGNFLIHGVGLYLIYLFNYFVDWFLPEAYEIFLLVMLP